VKFKCPFFPHPAVCPPFFFTDNLARRGRLAVPPILKRGVAPLAIPPTTTAVTRTFPQFLLDKFPLFLPWSFFYLFLPFSFEDQNLRIPRFLISSSLQVQGLTTLSRRSSPQTQVFSPAPHPPVRSPLLAETSLTEPPWLCHPWLPLTVVLSTFSSPGLCTRLLEDLPYDVDPPLAYFFFFSKVPSLSTSLRNIIFSPKILFFFTGNSCREGSYVLCSPYSPLPLPSLSPFLFSTYIRIDDRFLSFAGSAAPPPQFEYLCA